MLDMKKMVSFMTNHMDGKIQFILVFHPDENEPFKIVIMRFKYRNLIITKDGISCKDNEDVDVFCTYYLKASTLKVERECVKEIKEFIKNNSS